MTCRWSRVRLLWLLCCMLALATWASSACAQPFASTRSAAAIVRSQGFISAFSLSHGSMGSQELPGSFVSVHLRTSLAGTTLCALNQSSMIACWIIPDALFMSVPLVPVHSAFDGLQLAAFTLGRNHSCALLLDRRTVRCAGDNSQGQLNVPLIADPAVSVLSLQSSEFSNAQLTGMSNCFQLSNHSVRCWGSSAVASVQGSGFVPGSTFPPLNASFWLFTHSSYGSVGVALDGTLQFFPALSLPFRGLALVQPPVATVISLALTTGSVEGIGSMLVLWVVLSSGAAVRLTPYADPFFAPTLSNAISGDTNVGVVQLSVIDGRDACLLGEDYAVRCLGIDAAGRLGLRDLSTSLGRIQSVFVYLHDRLMLTATGALQCDGPVRLTPSNSSDPFVHGFAWSTVEGYGCDSILGLTASGKLESIGATALMHRTRIADAMDPPYDLFQWQEEILSFTVINRAGQIASSCISHCAALPTAPGPVQSVFITDLAASHYFGRNGSVCLWVHSEDTVCRMLPDRYASVSGVCGVLSSNGTVHCWSESLYSMALPPVRYQSVVAGLNAACGLTVDGQIYCLTDASSGQPVSSPVFPTAGPWRQLTAEPLTGDLFCAVTVDGAVLCSGPAPAVAPAQSLTGLNASLTATYSVGAARVPCPRGAFSNSAGAAHPVCSGLCAAGRYAATSDPFPTSAVCPRVCPAGAYCPLGDPLSPRPCPAGAFGSSVGLEDADCNGACPLGYFCPVGSISPNANPCPSGRYGNTTSVNEYCSGNCTAGLICPAATVDPTLLPCGNAGIICPAQGVNKPVSTGFYSICPVNGVLVDYSHCYAEAECPRGFACVAGIKTPCPAGSVQNRTGQQSCDQCALGQYASSATECVLCPAGRFGATSGLWSADCSGPCPAGYWCAVGSTSGTAHICAAGRFGGLGSSNSSCGGRCDPGYLCPAGTTLVNERTCGSANVFCATAAAATPVSTGFASVCVSKPGGGVDQTRCYAEAQCLEGHQCVGGVETPCEAGAVQPHAGQSFCSQCAAGSYSEGPGGSECLACPAGRYGTSAGLPSSACSGPCPLGFYCPAATVSATSHPCPAGRYGNATSADALCSGECDRGYLCATGSTQRNQQPCGNAGTYCPSAAMRYSTSAGFYSICPRHADNSTDHTTCFAQEECPRGSACVAGFANLCQPGFVQNRTGQTSCAQCDAGSFSASVGGTECTPCEAGSYSQQRGAIQCTICPAGSVSEGTGASAPCAPCPAGHQPNALRTQCARCPPHYYSLSGQPSCSFCSTVVSLNQSECLPSGCDAGFELVHDSERGATCAPCELGSTSTVGNPCAVCPPAHFSPSAGSPVCISCLDDSGLQCENGVASVLPGFFAYQAPTQLTFRSNNVTRCPTLDSCTYSTLAYRTAACPGVEFCPGQRALQRAGSLDALTGNRTVGVSGLSSCVFPRATDAANLLCGRCADGYSAWGTSCLQCDQSNGGLIFLAVVVSGVILLFLFLTSHGGGNGILLVALYFAQTAMIEVGTVTAALDWLSVLNLTFGSSTGAQLAGGRCPFDVDPYQLVVLNLMMPLILLAELLVAMTLHWTLCRMGFCRRSRHASESEAAAAQTAVSANEVALQCASDSDQLQSNPAVSKLGSLTAQTESAPSLPPSSSAFDFARYVQTARAVCDFTYTQVTLTCFVFLSCTSVNGVSVVFGEPAMRCDSSEWRSTLVLVVLVLIGYVCGWPLAGLMGGWMTRRHRAQSAAASSSATRGWLFALLSSRVSLFGPSCWFWSSLILLRRVVILLIDSLIVRQPLTRVMLFSLLHLGALLLQLWQRPFVADLHNRLEAMSLLMLVCVSLLLGAGSPPFTVAQQVILCLLILPTVFGFVGLMIVQHARNATRNRAEDTTVQGKPQDDDHLQADVRL